MDGPAVEPVDLAFVFGQDFGLGEAVFFGDLGKAVNVPGGAGGDQGDIDFWSYGVGGGLFGGGGGGFAGGGSVFNGIAAVLGEEADGNGKDASQ